MNRIEAAAKALYRRARDLDDEIGGWTDHQFTFRHEAEDVLAAADAIMFSEAAVREVADLLAYFRCVATNPKASHPNMGFYAFNAHQRAFLRDEQMDNARAVIEALKGAEA